MKAGKRSSKELNPNLKVSSLKIGDKVRIVSLPVGYGNSDYYIHRDTVTVFNKIIARKRAVRIDSICEKSSEPCYLVKFKEKDGWHWHHLSISEADKNWILCQIKI